MRSLTDTAACAFVICSRDRSYLCLAALSTHCLCQSARAPHCSGIVGQEVESCPIFFVHPSDRPETGFGPPRFRDRLLRRWIQSCCTNHRNSSRACWRQLHILLAKLRFHLLHISDLHDILPIAAIAASIVFVTDSKHVAKPVTWAIHSVWLVRINTVSSNDSYPQQSVIPFLGFQPWSSRRWISDWDRSTCSLSLSS